MKDFLEFSTFIPLEYPSIPEGFMLLMFLYSYLLLLLGAELFLADLKVI